LCCVCVVVLSVHVCSSVQRQPYYFHFRKSSTKNGLRWWRRCHNQLCQKRQKKRKGEGSGQSLMTLQDSPHTWLIPHWTDVSLRASLRRPAAPCAAHSGSEDSGHCLVRPTRTRTQNSNSPTSPPARIQQVMSCRLNARFKMFFP
jgi:hypothetical protein